MQDAQKGQTSHPPNPGAPRRALSHARPQRATKDDPSKLARVRCPQDGPDESLTARVQRGSSETARCASTGDSPGHPSHAGGLFQHPVTFFLRWRTIRQGRV